MQVKLVSKFVYKLSVVKRSYYEILDLQPNFTEKQLRQQFLKKGTYMNI